MEVDILAVKAFFSSRNLWSSPHPALSLYDIVDSRHYIIHHNMLSTAHAKHQCIHNMHLLLHILNRDSGADVRQDYLTRPAPASTTAVHLNTWHKSATNPAIRLTCKHIGQQEEHSITLHATEVQQHQALMHYLKIEVEIQKLQQSEFHCPRFC